MSSSADMPASVQWHARPEELPEDARRLLAAAGERNIELGYDWYANLTATVYKDSEDVRFYVLRQGGIAQAVLPVRLEATRAGLKIASLANFYTALYEPACDAGLPVSGWTTLLKELKKDFPRAWCLWFSPMDPNSAAYRALLAACRESGWVSFPFFCFGNWYLRVEEAWPAYFQKRAGAVRSTVKRMSKKFTAAGGRLEVASEPAQLPKAIAAYEQIYARSWKKPEPHPDFIQGLIDTFGSTGQLLMGVAWIGEQPVASQIWLVQGERAEIFKLAYDEDFKEYSPGTLLTTLLMEQVFDSVKEVDYLIGDDGYKAAWMSDRRERWGFVAYRPFSLQGSLAIARETAARLLKRLRARTPGD